MIRTGVVIFRALVGSKNQIVIQFSVSVKSPGTEPPLINRLYLEAFPVILMPFKVIKMSLLVFIEKQEVAFLPIESILNPVEAAGGHTEPLLVSESL